MLRDPRIPAEQSKPQFRRYPDAELADIAKAPEHVAKINVKLADLKWPARTSRRRSAGACLGASRGVQAAPTPAASRGAATANERMGDATGKGMLAKAEGFMRRAHGRSA